MDSNLFWCIISIIGGAILGFITSLLFYYLGIKRKNLIYDVKTFCLISDKINQIDGLKITYNSNEISDLYSSTIIIKNIGNSIIEEQDLAPSCPLSISTDGKFLVDQSNGMSLFPLNKATNIHPVFTVNENNICNHIVISFDYIPKKEELTCSVLHTGKISFDGFLKEGKIIDNNSDIVKYHKVVKHFCTSLIIGLAMALFAIFLYYNSIIDYQKRINEYIVTIIELEQEINELKYEE